MKSSTLPQYTSNPSLAIINKKSQIYDEQQLSFQNNNNNPTTNKIQHAKSYVDLYQTNTLSVSPSSPLRIKTNSNVDDEKREKIFFEFTSNNRHFIKSSSNNNNNNSKFFGCNTIVSTT